MKLDSTDARTIFTQNLSKILINNYLSSHLERHYELKEKSVAKKLIKLLNTFCTGHNQGWSGFYQPEKTGKNPGKNLRGFCHLLAKTGKNLIFDLNWLRYF